jgi:hypothetical protein
MAARERRSVLVYLGQEIAEIADDGRPDLSADSPHRADTETQPPRSGG